MSPDRTRLRFPRKRAPVVTMLKALPPFSPLSWQIGCGRGLLLLLLSVPAVYAHDHPEEISEEMANAPVDAILWIHMFLQASIWGILFPIGMVLGLSRSRWHVPLQVSYADLLFFRSGRRTRNRPRASRSRSPATFSATPTAAGSSIRAHTALSPSSSSCRSPRSSLSASISSCTYTNGRYGLWQYARMASSESRTPCLGGHRCCLARSCLAGTVGMTHCPNVWRIISWCVPR